MGGIMFDWFSSLSPVFQAGLACIFTWSVTALGASLVFLMKKINKTFMDGMLGFAAGVMIAASFWSLLSPGIQQAEELGLNAWIMASLGFISGGLLLFISDNIYKLYQSHHPRHRHESKQESFKRCLMLIVSITIHNIPEGMAVGVAFGSVGAHLPGATLTGALAVAIGIGLQNFPEGTAVSFPLRREGYSRAKAFFYGQLSGVVEPIAGIIGVLLVLKVQLLMPFLLCFAAGAMIYVVVQELIPESQTNKQKDLMALFTLIGFSVMMILDVALG